MLLRNVTVVIGLFFPGAVCAQTFYVATDGDNGGTGGSGDPWATITHAVNTVPDGAEIVVRAGTYNGQVRIDREFANGITVRSESPYAAKLRHNAGAVVRCFRGRNITFRGFDIAHASDNSGPLVFHVQDLLGDVAGPGDGSDPQVSNIVIENNIIHDSTDNDLLKINNGARDITVRGNLFFNQRGHDEHMDINSVDNVVIEDNVLFNSFAANDNSTGAYIVVKDSNSDDDGYVGVRNVTVRRNIFLNWQGSEGSPFLLFGEDGHPYYEAFDCTAENNLFIGNSTNMMRAALGVKGSRDITFRNNTITGNLPSRAYAIRINTEGDNQAPDEIHLFNNIFSDPTGTMGTEALASADVFEVPAGQIQDFSLVNNLFWNNGAAIPADAAQAVRYTDDAQRITDSPALPALAGLVVPVWDGSTFADGSTSIREAFERLAEFARPGETSAALDAADATRAPLDDLLGRPRGSSPDVGAYEQSPVEATPVSGWFIH